MPVKRRPRGPRAKAVAASASGRHQPALEAPPGSRESRGPPRSCSRTDGQVPEPLTSRGGDSGAVSRGSRSTRRPPQPLGTRGETPGLAALPGFHAEERRSPEEPVLPSAPGGPAALRGGAESPSPLLHPEAQASGRLLRMAPGHPRGPLSTLMAPHWVSESVPRPVRPQIT